MARFAGKFLAFPWKREGRSEPASAAPGSVFSRLLHWAEATPNAPALADGRREISFKQLVRRSTRVAEALPKSPPLPCHAVGILLRDGLKSLQAAVGVLGAGHPVIFLENRQRRDRLRQLCAASEMRHILTDESGVPLAEQAAPGARIHLAPQLMENGATVRADLLPGAMGNADAPFSITCTSGSSGSPKAFLRNQRAVLQGAANYQIATGLGPGDRLMICSPPTFGLGLHGTFAALCCGAACLPVDFSRLPAADLPGLLTTLRPTLLLATPTIVRTLVNVGTPADFSSLRGVTCAGESLRSEDVQRLHGLLRDDAFIENAYGISDCGGIVCRGRIHRPPNPSQSNPSVGRPCQGFSLRAVDESGALPEGEIGRIEVTSDCLPCLLGSDQHPKSLVTGDLGRLLPDGSWELTGRADDRIKVHGQFISISEMEAALSHHPAVADVAIGTTADAPDRLVAWLVERPGFAASPRDIREHLQHTVASPILLAPHCIVVPALPRLPGGKVDRQRLVSEQRSTDIHPDNTWHLEDELGSSIHAAWTAALSHPPPHSQADFFACGGDSLSALHACGILSRQLNRKITPTTLVQHPTPALLAEALRRQTPEEAVPPAFQLLRNGSATGEAVLIFPGGIGAEEIFASVMAFLTPLELPFPIIGFRPEGLAAHPHELASFSALAAFLASSLGAGFPNVDRWVIFGGCAAAGLAFETARRLELAGRRTRLITLDGVPPSFFQTRPLRLRLLDDTASAAQRAYFDLLLSSPLTPWHTNLDLLLSTEFAGDSPDSDLGWSAFTSGEIRPHVFAGDHLTYLRLRRPALTDRLRQILATPR